MAKTLADLGSLGSGLYTGIVNPGSVFGLVGAFGGVGREDQVPAFHDKKNWGNTTDRVRHLGDGVWEFNDPTIGKQFTFRQNRDGDFTIADSQGNQRFQPQHEGIGWNLFDDASKIGMGGGADNTFNAGSFGPGLDPNKKTLPWQNFALRTGPKYNPATLESLAHDQNMAGWQDQQRARNNERMMATPSAGGFNMADAVQRSQDMRGKSYWEMSGDTPPPAKPKDVLGTGRLSSARTPYVGPGAGPGAVTQFNNQEYFMPASGPKKGIWQPVANFTEEERQRMSQPEQKKPQPKQAAPAPRPFGGFGGFGR